MVLATNYQSPKNILAKFWEIQKYHDKARDVCYYAIVKLQNNFQVNTCRVSYKNILIDLLFER